MPLFLTRRLFGPFGKSARNIQLRDKLALVTALEVSRYFMVRLLPSAALLISSTVATERYVVLSSRYLTSLVSIADALAPRTSSTLTDIAKLTALYLHDVNCPHRVLVIDVCSRGFEISASCWCNGSPVSSIQLINERREGTEGGCSSEGGGLANCDLGVVVPHHHAHSGNPFIL